MLCLLEKDTKRATARIDLNVPYVEQQQFQVFADEKELSEEGWMKDYNLRGFTFQKKGNEGVLKVKALADADIKLVLKGPWVKKGAVLVKRWVDYTSVTVNGEEILSETTPVWHNQPFTYVIQAKKGEEYIIKAKWQSHQE